MVAALFVRQPDQAAAAADCTCGGLKQDKDPLTHKKKYSVELFIDTLKHVGCAIRIVDYVQQYTSSHCDLILCFI